MRPVRAKDLLCSFLNVCAGESEGGSLRQRFIEYGNNAFALTGRTLSHHTTQGAGVAHAPPLPWAMILLAFQAAAWPLKNSPNQSQFFTTLPLHTVAKL